MIRVENQKTKVLVLKGPPGPCGNSGEQLTRSANMKCSHEVLTGQEAQGALGTRAGGPLFQTQVDNDRA